MRRYRSRICQIQANNPHSRKKPAINAPREGTLSIGKIENEDESDNDFEGVESPSVAER
jgi:hypothetical protein